MEIGVGEESLGARFLAAREARNLPIEQVAHETRIRIQRIREIENDDLSHFSHPSYARMFLSDYARYLGVPVAEIRHLLPAPGAIGCEGYQYLQSEREESFPRVARAIRPRRVARTMLIGAAAVFCAVFAVQAVVMIRNIERLNEHSVAQTAPAAETAPPTPAGAASAPAKEAVQPPPPAPTSAAVSPFVTDQMFASGVVDHETAVQ